MCLPEYELVVSDRFPIKSFCLLTPRPVEHPERVDGASNAVMNTIRRRVKWSTGLHALSVVMVMEHVFPYNFQVPLVKWLSWSAGGK